MSIDTDFYKTSFSEPYPKAVIVAFYSSGCKLFINDKSGTNLVDRFT